MVVYLNKVDAADAEMVELAEMEVREVMTDVGYNGSDVPVIAGSALCALENAKPEIGRDSVIKLLDTVDEYIPEPKRDIDKPGLLAIEHIYSIVGRGTVVSGRLERGKFKVGQEIEVAGYGKSVKTKINGIEMFRKTLDGKKEVFFLFLEYDPSMMIIRIEYKLIFSLHFFVTEAIAGDTIGILLKGVKKDEVRRGMTVAPIGTIEPHDQPIAKVYLLKKEEGGINKPFLTSFSAQMYSRTFDIQTQLNFLNKEMALPGEDVEVHMRVRKHCHR